MGNFLGINVCRLRLEDYLKVGPAIDVCVVFCPTQTHLVAVVSPAGDPPDTGGITVRLAAANAA